MNRHHIRRDGRGPRFQDGAQQIYQGKKVLRVKGLGLHPARGA